MRFADFRRVFPLLIALFLVAGGTAAQSSDDGERPRRIALWGSSVPNGTGDELNLGGYTGRLRELSERDSIGYVYGTDHPILRGRYRSGAREYNRVQVFGKAHLGEAFDWEEVGEVFERLLQVHDLNMDTTQRALDRARSVMRRQALDALGGEIVAPVNSGLELYDVIEVNDATAGTTAARRRVLGLELRYSRLREPEYVHALSLGGV